MWLGEELRCAWLAAGYTSQDQFALGLYVRLAGIARKSNGPIPGWFCVTKGNMPVRSKN